jgi:hypothetical protein
MSTITTRKGSVPQNRFLEWNALGTDESYLFWTVLQPWLHTVLPSIRLVAWSSTVLFLLVVKLMEEMRKKTTTHTLLDVFGYENVCVVFDTHPFKFIAASLFPFFVEIPIFVWWVGELLLAFPPTQQGRLHNPFWWILSSFPACCFSSRCGKIKKSYKRICTTQTNRFAEAGHATALDQFASFSGGQSEKPHSQVLPTKVKPPVGAWVRFSVGVLALVLWLLVRMVFVIDPVYTNVWSHTLPFIGLISSFMLVAIHDSWSQFSSPTSRRSILISQGFVHATTFFVCTISVLKLYYIITALRFFETHAKFDASTVSAAKFIDRLWMYSIVPVFFLVSLLNFLVIRSHN